MIASQPQSIYHIGFTPPVPYAVKCEVWAKIGYVPTLPSIPFHEAMCREKFIFGGWRAGKSFNSSADVLPLIVKWHDEMRSDQNKGLLWLIGPDFRQTHAEFEYLLGWLQKLNMVDGDPSMPKEGRWEMRTVNGWLIQTQSSTNIASLGSVTVNAIIVCEAGQQPPDVRDWALGRTGEKSGPVIYSGTMEDSGQWYMDAYTKYINNEDPDIFSCSIPMWNNPKFKTSNHPEIKRYRKTMSWNQYLLKICGKRAKPHELVFPEFMERPEVYMEMSENEDEGEIEISNGPICHVSSLAEYQPGQQVYLAVDPGEVYTVLMCHIVTLFQKQHPRHKVDDSSLSVTGILVFDEIYIEHGHFEQIRRKLLDHACLEDIDISYHDQATKQHHNQDSQQELWQRPRDLGGLGIKVLTAPLGIADGVNLMHRWLVSPLTGQPLIYYNPRCKNAIKEFSLEKYRKDKGLLKNDLPLDKHNHARKAMCYMINVRWGKHLPYEREKLSEQIKPIHNWNRYSSC